MPIEREPAEVFTFTSLPDEVNVYTAEGNDGTLVTVERRVSGRLVVRTDGGSPWQTTLAELYRPIVGANPSERRRYVEACNALGEAAKP